MSPPNVTFVCTSIISLSNEGNYTWNLLGVRLLRIYERLSCKCALSFSFLVGYVSACTLFFLPSIQSKSLLRMFANDFEVFCGKSRNNLQCCGTNDIKRSNCIIFPYLCQIFAICININFTFSNVHWRMFYIYMSNQRTHIYKYFQITYYYSPTCFRSLLWPKTFWWIICDWAYL